MPERTFHPLDYVSLLRRRAWWAILPLALCVVVGVALTQVLPRVYRSQATIGISSPRVSADLVGHATPITKEERVRAVSQQLLSRPVLERVVREEGLAAGRTVDAAVDDLLGPDRVRVEPMQLWKQAADRAPFDAFVLSYAGGTAQEAQRVTNRLAQVFVETNSRSREARAEDTSAFIGTQLDASKTRLDALEAQLRKAKEAYMGRLPEQTSANLSMVSGLRQQLESTAIALRGEQDRLSMLDRQVDAMKQGASGDEVLPGGVRLPPAQARVVTLQQQLADARTRYTEKHPEIQRLTGELEDAKKEAAAERTQPQSDRLAQLQLDPSYRQLTSDRERARLRVADLQRAEQQLRAQVAMYQSRVESAPMVEQQLVSLQRDYDLEKQQYTALSERRRAAELNESLERGQAGEQFKVLYAAYLPRDPESPNVVRILLLSVVLGIGLGGASAMAREYFDRSVHDVRALQSEFDVPVLAEISRIPHYQARSAR